MKKKTLHTVYTCGIHHVIYFLNELVAGAAGSFEGRSHHLGCVAFAGPELKKADPGWVAICVAPSDDDLYGFYAF